MRAWMSQLACCALLLVLTGVEPASVSEPIVPLPEDPAAAAAEVRLRKLHLVRPDLIPYPISFDVYC